jgi:hypothetical protein
LNFRSNDAGTPLIFWREILSVCRTVKKAGLFRATAACGLAIVKSFKKTSAREMLGSPFKTGKA